MHMKWTHLKIIVQDKCHSFVYMRKNELFTQNSTMMKSSYVYTYISQSETQFPLKNVSRDRV